jgi:3-oxoacyl-[acyl-carrier-protein] synthase II
MDPLVVSGIGVLCPGVTGRDALLARLTGNAAADPPDAPRMAEFALEERLPGGRAFRRVAGATKWALAAMAEAVRDAGFAREDFGGERTGLVVGITHGAVPYSAEFHRVLLLEGPAAASPLHFTESVPNAPAGNGAVAFGIRGPVHSLIGEEPVGTQAVELAAHLLWSGVVDRCLVVGTEEWSEVVAHAYEQVEAAVRRRGGVEAIPALSEGAAALVLELEGGCAARGVRPDVRIAGWRLGRAGARPAELAIRDVVLAAFRAAGLTAAAADHLVLPLSRHRAAAMRGTAAACAWTFPAACVDLAPRVGNPAGAANLLQVAASAALLSAGRVHGPGVAVSTGITGTLSGVVLSSRSAA